MSAHPVIYRTGTLSEFILHLVATHGASTILVICMSREEFLRCLLKSTDSQPSLRTAVDDTGTARSAAGNIRQDHEDPEELLNSTSGSSGTLHPLLVPTLRLLSASRGIRIACVTSVPALHAYLAILPSATSQPSQTNSPNRDPAKAPTFALVNLVSLHRDTASFSAQGLGRAFAAAVEAAWVTRMRVVVFEDLVRVESGGVLGNPGDDDAPVGGGLNEHDERMVTMEEGGGADADVDRHDGVVDGHDASMNGAEGEASTNVRVKDVWTEEVPILNAATKTFGPAGERRGWLGRTVRVGDVAARWFTFEDLPTHRMF